MLHQASPDGVEMDITRDRPEVGLILDQLGAIAALEDVAGEAMASGPGVGIRGEQHLHAPGEVGLRGLDDDMKVVGHQDEGVDPPGAADRGAGEVVAEAGPVVVVADDILSAVAAGHEVVDGAGILEA